jgi:hypothetical protein
VNGFVDKCDANFIGQFFYDNLDGHKIFMGNYPSDINDINRLKNVGVTGVLNLQTPENMKSRSVNSI